MGTSPSRFSRGCVCLFLLVFLVVNKWKDANATRKNLGSNGRVFGKYGSVKVDMPGSSSAQQQWVSSDASGRWPEGIRLVNNLDQVRTNYTGKFPNAKTFQNATGYPYKGGFVQLEASPSGLNRQSLGGSVRSSTIVPVRRTYEWLDEELIISVNMSSPSGVLTAPKSTRLVPPLRWLSSRSAKVKVLQQSSGSDSRYLDAIGNSNMEDDERSATDDNLTNDEDDDITDTVSSYDSSSEFSTATITSRIIEITVRKSRAEKCLSTFRKFGFARQDIYRMLNKGPWILSLDISSTLPRLYEHLKVGLGLTNDEATHVVSHNPFLIAQYHQYKGRDVRATVLALKSVGYSSSVMFESVMRFPTMLSAPPDRIQGWYSLLSGYGVLMNGDFMRKASFIFNLNAPLLFDVEGSTSPNSAASATASEYVAYDALRNLEILADIRIPDINKVIRTVPLLLLTDSEKIRQRLLYLRHLLSFTDSRYVATARRRISWTPRQKSSSSHTDMAGAINPDTVANEIGSSRIVRYDDSEMSNLNINFYSETLRVNVTERDLLFWKSILLSNPSTLSIDKDQMRDVVMGMKKEGMTGLEVFNIIKTYPTVLSTSSKKMRGCLRFLKQYCDAREEDLYNIIKTNPKLLTLSMYDLIPKKDYLFQSLGGSPEMLRKCPKYLTYNSETFIIPRAEFLRALGMDPLELGLDFLVSSKERKFVEMANTTSEVFSRFRWAFNAKFKDRLKQEQEQVRQVIYPREEKMGDNSIGYSRFGTDKRKGRRDKGNDKVRSATSYGPVLLNVKTIARSESDRSWNSNSSSLEDDTPHNSSVAEMSVHRDR